MNTDYLNNLPEGRGHLHLTKEKKTDASPDMNGNVKINGDIYKVSAWKQEKNGKKYLSISIRKDEVQPVTATEEWQINDVASHTVVDNKADDLPF